MSLLLVVLVIKILVSLHRISSHLIRPFKVWFILYFPQDLMYRLPEYNAYHLGSSVPNMLSEILSRPIIVVSFRP